jgi:hypothetical protein
MDGATWSAVAMIAVIAAVMVVFAWGAYWDYRAKRMLHDERRLMIQQGLTPPPLVTGWAAVKYQAQELKHAERRQLIEQGLTPPPEPGKPPTVPEDYLRRGIFGLGIGLAMAITYFTLQAATIESAADAQAWCLGLAPLVTLIGLGNLIYYPVAKAGWKGVADAPPSAASSGESR